MDFKCNCLNSGINGFTGRCGRCGMEKHVNETPISMYSPETLQEVLNNLEKYILKLDRFNLETDEAGGWMQNDLEGEYVKIKDVLTLFGAKKE